MSPTQAWSGRSTLELRGPARSGATGRPWRESVVARNVDGAVRRRPSCAHQPGHALLAHRVAPFAEARRGSAGCRSALGSRRWTARSRLPDGDPRGRVGSRAAGAKRSSRSATPAAVGTSGAPGSGLLRGDERELTSLSLAKKAVAFFRMSRSIRRRAFSRRRATSSSFSGFGRPWPGNAFSPPTAKSCFHRRRTSAEIPSSAATSDALRPPRTRCTASNLYSRLKRRLTPMAHLRARTGRTHLSVHETGGIPVSPALNMPR